MNSFQTEKPRPYSLFKKWWTTGLKPFQVKSRPDYANKFFVHVVTGLILDVRTSIPSQFEENDDYRLIRVVGHLSRDHRGKLKCTSIDKLPECVIDWCVASDLQVNPDEYI